MSQLVTEMAFHQSLFVERARFLVINHSELHWLRTSERRSSFCTIWGQLSVGLSQTKVFLLRSVDRSRKRLQLSAKQVVPYGTICTRLSEYHNQHKFTHGVRYHSTCKVAHVLGVSVSLRLPCLNSRNSDRVLNSVVGG